MAPKKDFMAKLLALQGAVTVGEYNPHANVIQSSCPSINFAFGKGWGLPLGYSLLLYGPPKGGKSLLCYDMTGQLHRDDPEAVVVKFNTEYREKGQATPAELRKWGIDTRRYVAYEVNTPDLIFDRIETELAAMCEEGYPIKLVIIDSITSIQGRRAMNASSVMVQQIGDDAKTIQDGLKRILPVQRKYGFALILTAHLRAEMDQLQQMRGKKVRPAASWGTTHHCEYFALVEPNLNKDAKTDLLGNKFEDKEAKDTQENAEKTGHKLKFKIEDSSMGPKGRVGECTLDYKQGFINRHEEVFLLGKNRKVLERPNNSNVMWEFQGKQWRGEPAMLEAIRTDTDLAKEIVAEVKRRDQQGMFDAEDQAANENQEQAAAKAAE